MKTVLSTLIAILLVIMLPVNAMSACPAMVPSIHQVEAVRRFIHKNESHVSRGIASIVRATRITAVLLVAAATAAAAPEGVWLAAMPAIAPRPREFSQKATFVAQWENPMKMKGLTPLSTPAGVKPQDEALQRAFWGEWSVRPAYERAGMDYLVFLCRSAEELKAVVNELRSMGGLRFEGQAWFPCWTLFSDKGNHIVLTTSKTSSKAWLEAVGVRFDLRGRTDRLFKAMKRYRRTVARPEIDNPCETLSVQENWNGKKGFTLYTLLSGVTGKTFTVLMRPIIREADGFNFGTSAGVSKAWGRKARPLSGVALSGCCPQGTIKGHLVVVTPDKELPADFILTDPKDEMTSEGFTMNVLFTLHKYNVARTDFQSVLHFGLEPWLAGWAKDYLEDLKIRLLNTEAALQMIGDVHEDEDYSFALQQMKRVLNSGEVKMPFNLIPYWFRGLVNLALNGICYLDGSTGNEQNRNHSVRIPMPSDLYLRRYIGVWEDVVDEKGVETDPRIRILGPGESMMGLGWTGKVATWRQPNGSWKEHNLLNLQCPDHFSDMYGDRIDKWMDKSPFLFISSVNNKQTLQNWGGADFDDNVIVSRDPGMVANFEALSKLVYPAQRPESDRPHMNAELETGFVFDWKHIQSLVETVAQCKGIGYFCNRWMVGNYYSRLVQQNDEYSFLLDGVEAPIHVLGNESEVIIDSTVKLGGIGLESYEAIVAQFDTEVPYIFPSAYWSLGDGVYGSRVGSKAGTRLVNAGRIVELPIDHSLKEVSALVADFKVWADDTYEKLPLLWEFEPVIAQMDLADTSAHTATAADIRKRYATFFKEGGDAAEQNDSAQAWFAGVLDGLSMKDTPGVLNALFQSIYDQGPAGDHRYRGEALLWGSAVMNGPIGIWLPWAEVQQATFGGDLSFVSSFGMKRKLADGEVTDDQYAKWVMLANNKRPVALRQSGLDVDVYLITPTRECQIGTIRDRNAIRACSLGYAQATLAPYSRFSMLVNISIPETEVPLDMATTAVFLPEE